MGEGKSDFVRLNRKRRHNTTYVLLRNALKMKTKSDMRARPARIPVLVPQTYRAAVGASCDFSTPCTTTKRTPTASKPEFENPLSASFIVMRPAFQRTTMPEWRDVRRGAKGMYQHPLKDANVRQTPQITS
jgi:hypothetical protein